MKKDIKKILKTCGFILLLLSSWVFADDATYGNHQAARQFIDEMISEHGFDQVQLEAWFASAQKKQVILDAISKPAEKALSWKKYRKIFIKPQRIKQGVEFWQNNQEILSRAEKEFGVPSEIIVAIIGVETFYGRHKGKFRVIDALSTLGFDYPPRSSFFRKELKQFLMLAREQKKDPLELMGSYAGAMGYGQFIPSSYRAYAIDYDNDGFADIWNNETDAIGSVANYFKRHGWQPGKTVAVRSRIAKDYQKDILNKSLKPAATLAELKQKGFTPVNNLDQESVATAMMLEGEWGAEFWLGLHNFYVITRYNHSRLYAMAVLQLSQEILQAKSNSKGS
jgi:membrane-bound lytic murein transglycosylase B